MAVDTSMVGEDLSSPPQNPVPSNPQVNPPVNPYQVDPFEGAQRTRGRETTRVQGAGFRKKYQQDPYAQFQDETAGTDFQQPAYVTDEDWKATGDYAQYFQQDDNEPPGGTTPPPVDYNALQDFHETGLTQDNVSAVYSLQESELPQYGIDIHAPNVGDAPEGIVSGWNDEDGDGFDDDGHAYGTHGAVNVQTAAGEQSIQGVLDEAGQEQPWYSSLFDTGTAYLQDWAAPDVEATPYAPDGFMTSPGGAVGAALPGPIGAFAAIGGAISKANLDKIYAEHGEYNPETGLGVMPVGSVDGVTTPLAVSPGIFPNTTVVSGNTDLALQQNPYLDLDGDGTITTHDLQGYAGSENQAAYEQHVANEEAAQESFDNYVQQQENEGGGAYVGGTVVTDAHGNAVLDENNVPVTSGGTWTQFPGPPEPPPPAPPPPPPPPPQVAPEDGGDDHGGGGGWGYDTQTVQQETAATQSAYEQEAYGGGGGSGGSQSGQAYGSDHDWSAPAPQPQQNNDDGGGGGDGCFEANVEFLMADGSHKRIADINIGDEMAEGGRVYAVLFGDGFTEDWYCYGETVVTGSHFVYEDRWVPVEWSTQAVFLETHFWRWYCVLNEKHRMRAKDGNLFTDFDAVDSVNRELEERLNAKSEES